MELNLNTLIILLPFAFALHNFEEVLGMEKWTKSIPSFIHKPVTTRQFGIAVTLFTILGFIVTFSRTALSNGKILLLNHYRICGNVVFEHFLPPLISYDLFKKICTGNNYGAFNQSALDNGYFIIGKRFRNTIARADGTICNRWWIDWNFLGICISENRKTFGC